VSVPARPVTFDGSTRPSTFSFPRSWILVPFPVVNTRYSPGRGYSFLSRAGVPSEESQLATRSCRPG
jgi:hypothetical protein